MNKKTKIAHLVSKGLLSLMMVMSAAMYFFNNADMSAVVEGLGFPSFILIPLGVAKIMGIATLWFSKNNTLKEWAYSGFFFNFILAGMAHLMKADGGIVSVIIAVSLLATAYFTSKKELK